ncbi:glycoside hydrolase family 13 protein [Halalkalirubrum salinum]|uniref:glycoside hydrolase family 13 protein n=1 Tax=Halalkalirubrum salinum TaxID=2563889 RepID=UPI0010FBB2E3|nr:glycoside hydrolase family 13 protein [Halalkalirubrum salinum]
MTICRGAVSHRPKSNQAYAHTETTVHIRIKTARGDVERVQLLAADKYDFPESATRVPMERIGRDDTHDYWQVAIEPPHRRLCYAFYLADGEESLWLTEWGFEPGSVTDLPTKGTERALHYFEYPFINPIDIAGPPAWAADAVFYQIFPERFENGDPSRNPDDVADWEDAPTRSNFFGGDIQGIIDRLDYVDDLGATALYLTPVFESPSNHKYNTTDYMSVDPAFGDEETLSQLVDAAHDRDIRVVLDAVFNHCGRGFEPFQDVLEHGADSEYADWFHIREFPIREKPRPTYDAFAFEPYMPKLNTEHPEVREYLLDVATYWIETVDIDGWRLDVANEVDHDFWREFRREVKRIKPDAYILGEVWHNAQPWLEGDQFDAAMNYPFSYAVYGFLVDEEIDAAGFANRMDRFLARYPDRVNDVMFNLLGSHDTPRLLYRLDGDRDRLRLALTLLLTFRGAPCLYYGDEIAMTGGDDPDCRRPMIWDRTEQDLDLRAFVRELIATRTADDALRNGRVRFDRDRSAGDLLIYRRLGDPDTVVGLNRGADSVSIPVGRTDSATTGSAVDVLISTDGVKTGATGCEITLPPVSAAVWHESDS